MKIKFSYVVILCMVAGYAYLEKKYGFLNMLEGFASDPIPSVQIGK